jgi:diketogulonate reductase-like aldo/keto reductase
MAATDMNPFRLPSGSPVAPLGQGTWGLGDDRARRAAEIAALEAGVDLGLALIDTAEMYGDGRSEELIAEAIAGRRDDVYLVSKVYPHNATRSGTVEACKRSLKRLQTDYLDLYLLHWRESGPLAETLEAFVALKESGLIRHYGVSNFDRDDMEEASALPGGNAIATNQVLYNPLHRGIEWDLLPWCRKRGMPIMAYTPLGNSGSEQRRILGNATVKAIAIRHAAKPAQIALAWLLNRKDIVAVPKAATEAHVRQNRDAVDLRLTDEDLREIDRVFEPPRRKIPLEML